MKLYCSPFGVISQRLKLQSQAVAESRSPQKFLSKRQNFNLICFLDLICESPDKRFLLRGTRVVPAARKTNNWFVEPYTTMQLP